MGELHVLQEPAMMGGGSDLMYSGYAEDFGCRFCNHLKNMLLPGKVWIIADVYGEPNHFYNHDNWKEVYPLEIKDYIVKSESDLSLIDLTKNADYFQYCWYEKDEDYRAILEHRKFHDIAELEALDDDSKKRFKSGKSIKFLVVRLVKILPSAW